MTSAVLLALPFLVAACAPAVRMTYEPWEIEAARETVGAVPLDFVTEAGRQTVFYIPPGGRSDGPAPRTVVLLYPGIGSRALDWLNWLGLQPPCPGVGYLLIDYPGRGRCEGDFRPRGLEKNSAGALDALSAHLKVDRRAIDSDLALVGHSFGTGAALQFAAETHARRIVLIAPFSTLRRALFRRIGPLAWVLPDGMDNLGRIEELMARGDPPAVLILHGDADKSLPVKMGRQLAGRGGAGVTYEESPGVGHVDILYRQRARIVAWACGGDAD